MEEEKRTGSAGKEKKMILFWSCNRNLKNDIERTVVCNQP